MVSNSPSELFKFLSEVETSQENYESNTISLVASSMYSPQCVRAFGRSILGNVTAEGYPSKRYHPGAGSCDEVESLAIRLACEAFSARHANVQPHSASSANLAILLGFLDPGDTVLGMDLKAGGHLTHGSPASFSGKIFNSISYGLKSDLLDLSEVRKTALINKPKLIICGSSSYPRRIDFSAFRDIADEVGALLLADISHIAGFVVSGLHQSPVPYADFVTTSTYKQLMGPHGGLILAGNRTRIATEEIDRSVFPFSQGTPDFSRIAGKAAALGLTKTTYFNNLMARIKESAEILSNRLMANGIALKTEGTDTHLILIDLEPEGVSGLEVERCLEKIGVLTNRNLIADDKRSPNHASGLRLGSNMLGYRKLSVAAIESIADTITTIISSRATLDISKEKELANLISEIAQEFPIIEPDL